MANWRILVVEDDPDGQEVINRILNHYGVDVDMADTGTSALSLLNQGEYNVAIIDLALPTMDGWQLLNAIRDDPHTAVLPCLAVTAYHSAEVANSALQAGFSAYLQKPVEAGPLMKALEGLLD